MKVNAGWSSSSMLKDAKEIEKIFQQSKVIMTVSSQIQWKRLTP
jgi:hypothetical protein